MAIRVRFAPSPTGHVHIGNIRTAIFNWLFARHENGKFLLRVEDTDLERSTRDAIDTLLDCMSWLGLDYDDEIVYQTQLRENHLKAVDKLIEEGKAYRLPGDDGLSKAVAFRIPWETDDIASVRTVGTSELAIHPDQPVTISRDGVRYAAVSKKGKPIPETVCLAGFRDLCIENEVGECLFQLGPDLEEVFAESDTITVSNGTKFRFLRREVVFKDLVKGELAKALDSMKDIIIVRSDGSPIFHLANVCDDIEQEITHIIRGEDHVENTYRHIFLFDALGHPLPEYAHLPMIVNQQGKPFSKRDGDAYVGDFRTKGYLPEALFNYLMLLGWSPGDDREKLSRQESIALFSLDRVKSHSAQFDYNKLRNLNGKYIAEMSPELFCREAERHAAGLDWFAGADATMFRNVAELMQIRTNQLDQVDSWSLFFTDDIEYDRKEARKSLKPEVKQALQTLVSLLTEDAVTDRDAMERLLQQVEERHGLGQGKLNKPLRIAVTGVPSGADLVDTLLLLGNECVIKRINTAIDLQFD